MFMFSPITVHTETETGVFWKLSTLDPVFRHSKCHYSVNEEPKCKSSPFSPDFYFWQFIMDMSSGPLRLHVPELISVYYINATLKIKAFLFYYFFANLIWFLSTANKPVSTVVSHSLSLSNPGFITDCLWSQTETCQFGGINCIFIMLHVIINYLLA